MIGKVQPGEPVKAEQMNYAIQGNQRLESASGNGLLLNVYKHGMTLNVANAAESKRDGIVVSAVNQGATKIEPYEPVAVTGQAFDDNDDEINDRVLLTVSVPSSENDAIAVALDSLDPNEGGRVFALGVTLVYLRLNEDDKVGSYRFAGINPAVATNALTLAEEGPVEVLWKDATVSTTARGLALVRFPVGGGGGSGWQIEVVSTFPPIPSTPNLVFGSSSKQPWYAAPGMIAWKPMGDYTGFTGSPGSNA